MLPDTHLSACYQINLISLHVAKPAYQTHISLHVTWHTSFCMLPDKSGLSACCQTCISLQVTRHTSLCKLPDTHHSACYQTNLISLQVTKHTSLCRLPDTHLCTLPDTHLCKLPNIFTQAQTQHVQSVSWIWLGRVGFFVGINGQKNDIIFKKLRFSKLSYKASCN